MKYWRKNIAFLVSITFCINTIGYAASPILPAVSSSEFTSGSNFLVNQAIQPEEKNVSSFSDFIDSYEVSPDLGRITQKFKGESDKCIVLLQDAHCNYEAQLNQSEIIKDLIENHGFEAVYLEGAVGKVDTSIFTAYPNIHIKEKVFKESLKNGEINGADYYSIMRTDALTWIHGIEDQKLYEKNYRAALKLLKYRDEIKDQISLLRGNLELMKKRTYSRRLLALDSLCLKVNKCAANTAVNKYSELLAMLLSYVEEYKLNCKSYPSIERILLFADENQSFDDLDAEDLLCDINSFAVYLKEKLFRNDAERKIDALAQFLCLFDKGLSIDLSRTEWEQFESLFFNDVIKSIKKLHIKHCISFEYDSAFLRSALDSIFNFYSLVIARDKAINLNLQKCIKQNSQKKIIVVLGGFHASVFKKDLEGNMISYFSVIPQAEFGVNSRSGYFQKLLEPTVVSSTLALADTFDTYHDEDIQKDFISLKMHELFRTGFMHKKDILDGVVSNLKLLLNDSPDHLQKALHLIDEIFQGVEAKGLASGNKSDSDLRFNPVFLKFADFCSNINTDIVNEYRFDQTQLIVEVLEGGVWEQSDVKFRRNRGGNCRDLAIAVQKEIYYSIFETYKVSNIVKPLDDDLHFKVQINIDGKIYDIEHYLCGALPNDNDLGEDDANLLRMHHFGSFIHVSDEEGNEEYLFVDPGKLIKNVVKSGEYELGIGQYKNGFRFITKQDLDQYITNNPIVSWMKKTENGKDFYNKILRSKPLGQFLLLPDGTQN